MSSPDAGSGTALPLIGQHLTHYRITGHVGSGGMGEVYEARDLKLGRSVAIKLLPEIFQNDAERMSRFRREARALAALNHQNIATLHEMNEVDGKAFLVMELVSGDTLAARIQRGPIPFAEVSKIASQIIEALEAAHQAAIIHRDLKPANIKITGTGLVKVLDFGLAKMRLTDGLDASDSLTQSSVSSSGMIFGTPAYMSPEQAKGEESGHASDIWAFGCVVYEMLAGRRPFQGSTTAEVVAEVLKAAPDWTLLRSETPEWMRRVLRRCLEKDPRSRFHDVADVRIAMEDARDTEASVARPARSRPGAREILAWLVALFSLAAALILFWRAPQPAAEVRVDIITPPESDAGSLAISHDGRKIVYGSLTSGKSNLWLRSMDSGLAQLLPGTEGASLPFWSPTDGSIGFFAASKLKRIDLETGVVRPLADSTLSPSGGTWNSDGVILFSRSIAGGIFQIREAGGPVTLQVEGGLTPKFLPDGKHFVYQVLVGPRMGTFVGSLDGREPYRLFDNRYVSIPAPFDQLLSVREGNLYSQRFHPGKLTPVGDPQLVAERVLLSSDGGLAAVSVSDTGTVAYRATAKIETQTRKMVLFDRTGKELGSVGELGGFSPTLSPQGDFVAVSRNAGGRADVWLLEMARGVLSPFTTNAAGQTPASGNQTPLWSPDGRYIVFSSSRNGRISLYRQPWDGGPDEPLLTTPNNKVATDWSAEYILYRENDPKTSFDIWALPMKGTGLTPKPILRSEFGERDAQFAPNGKWIAYESNRAGVSQIYLYPFPGPGRELPVSIDGGAQVRWNPNGRELFFVSLGGMLMAVPIHFSADSNEVTPGKPLPLFQTRMGPVLQSAHKQQYVVTRDGRFLMSTVAEDAFSPITLILNWSPR